MRASKIGLYFTCMAIYHASALDCAYTYTSERSDLQYLREQEIYLWLNNQPLDSSTHLDTLNYTLQYAKAVYKSNWDWLRLNLKPNWQRPSIFFVPNSIDSILEIKFQQLEMDFSKHLDPLLLQSHQDFNQLQSLWQSSQDDSVQIAGEFYQKLKNEKNPWTLQWLDREFYGLKYPPIDPAFTLGLELSQWRSYSKAQPNFSSSTNLGIILGWAQPWYNIVIEDKLGLGFLAKPLIRDQYPKTWLQGDAVLLTQVALDLQLKAPISHRWGIHPILSLNFDIYNRSLPFVFDSTGTEHLLWGYGLIFYKTLNNIAKKHPRPKGSPIELLGLKFKQKQSFNLNTPMEWELGLIWQLSTR